MNQGTRAMNFQSRHRSLRTHHLAGALWLTLASFAQAAEPASQEATPAAAAGPQQAQALPEPQMAAQPSFVLQGVEFVGASGIPEAELQGVVADRIGASVSFADLEQLAARVAAHYHQRGFALVQAYVPVQEVVDGRVRIMVSESVLGNVAIDMADGTPLQRERVARTLAVLEAGKPLNGPRYERAMLLLSDLPGVRATPAEQPTVPVLESDEASPTSALR